MLCFRQFLLLSRLCDVSLRGSILNTVISGTDAPPTCCSKNPERGSQSEESYLEGRLTCARLSGCTKALYHAWNENKNGRQILELIWRPLINFALSNQINTNQKVFQRERLSGKHCGFLAFNLLKETKIAFEGNVIHNWPRPFCTKSDMSVI